MRIARLGLWFCATAFSACAAAPGDKALGPSAAAASLSGTRWVGVVDNALDARNRPQLEFVSEGRLAGYTGCNMLSGRWTIEAGVVRLSGIVTTKRACVGPEGEVERQVLAALSEQSRLTREVNKLVVSAPSGARFEFVPAAPNA